MKKLSKEALEEHKQILEALEKAQQAVESEFERYSGAVGDYNEALEAYSDQLEAANAFAQNIAEQVESYVSEKSERWQDSEAGAQISDWGQEWGGIEYDRLDLEDTPNLPSFDVSEFENMRTDSEE
jgi:chromosome segregation ATPase